MGRPSKRALTPPLDPRKSSWRCADASSGRGLMLSIRRPRWVATPRGLRTRHGVCVGAVGVHDPDPARALERDMRLVRGLRRSALSLRIAREPGEVRTVRIILLRWSVQRGIPVVPKSSHRERIEENARIFDFTLSDADVAQINALDGRAAPTARWNANGGERRENPLP